MKSNHAERRCTYFLAFDRAKKIFYKSDADEQTAVHSFSVATVVDTKFLLNKDIVEVIIEYMPFHVDGVDNLTRS